MVRRVSVKRGAKRSTWVAQSVKCPTSAQAIISSSVCSSPALGSVLTAEPGACFGFCVSLSFCPSPAHALSLKNKYMLRNMYLLYQKKIFKDKGATKTFSDEQSLRESSIIPLKELPQAHYPRWKGGHKERMKRNQNGR